MIMTAIMATIRTPPATDGSVIVKAFDEFYNSKKPVIN